MMIDAGNNQNNDININGDERNDDTYKMMMMIMTIIT